MSTAASRGAAAGTEFSADTADLGHFVERGRSYVAGLEAILDRLRAKRSLVLSSIGIGTGPADRSSRPLRELVAEASINNSFVDGIRRTLSSFGGASVDRRELVERIDAELVSTGLDVAGVDRTLERDRDLVRRFRTRQLISAGLDSARVAALVGRSSATDAALRLLALGVHPDAVAAASIDRLEEVSTRFPAGGDVENLEALLTDHYAPDLHRLILAGDVAPPTDGVRERVVAAMTAGLGPEQARLAPSYFPAAYRDHLRLSARIDAAEARREVADGSSWSWFDSDDRALAAVDRELAALRASRDRLAAANGIGAGGAVDFLAAIAAVADASAGSRWEGERYAFLVDGYRQGKISSGGIFGHGEGALEEPDGFQVELGHVGRRVAAEPLTALAFYDGIGVAGTADLATLLAGNELERATFEDYGRGLAAASNATSPSGAPSLGFSGADLMRQPKAETRSGVVWYSPSLLFLAGRFRPAFVAGAAEATLRRADDGDRAATSAHLGQRTLPGPTGPVTIRFDGGEDPRNILLSRVAGDPAAVRALIRSLGGPRGRRWPGAPARGSLDPLLKPVVPFAPAVGPQPERHWLDRLKDLGNVADPGHDALDPIAYPRLASPYPITSLLGAVAEQAELSRWLLRYAARTVAEDGPMLRDPGTAAGLDLIMADHATVMFDEPDLDAVGIGRTELNRETSQPLTAEHWKAVHGDVLRLGRGQAMAARADTLLSLAVAGAIDADGRFHSELTRSFAHMAGRTEAESYEALFTYSSQLDDRAKADNRSANTAASAALGALGLVPGVSLPALAASTGWAWFFDGYPTGSELVKIREAWRKQYFESDSQRWQLGVATVYLDDRLSAAPPGHATHLPMLFPDGTTRQVRIRRDETPGGLRFSWQDRVGGTWHEVPRLLTDDFDRRFVGADATPYGAAVMASGFVETAYHAGKQASLPVRSSGSIDTESITHPAVEARWTDLWIAG